MFSNQLSQLLDGFAGSRLMRVLFAILALYAIIGGLTNAHAVSLRQGWWFSPFLLKWAAILSIGFALAIASRITRFLRINVGDVGAFRFEEQANPGAPVLRGCRAEIARYAAGTSEGARLYLVDVTPWFEEGEPPVIGQPLALGGHDFDRELPFKLASDSNTIFEKSSVAFNIIRQANHGPFVFCLPESPSGRFSLSPKDNCYSILLRAKAHGAVTHEGWFRVRLDGDGPWLEPQVDTPLDLQKSWASRVPPLRQIRQGEEGKRTNLV
jgi:hypothetical protein